MPKQMGLGPEEQELGIAYVIQVITLYKKLLCTYRIEVCR